MSSKRELVSAALAQRGHSARLLCCACLWHMLVQGQVSLLSMQYFPGYSTDATGNTTEWGGRHWNSLLWLPVLWSQKTLSIHLSPVFPQKTGGEEESLVKPREQGAQLMPFFIIMPFLNFFMNYCWVLPLLLFLEIWFCSLGCGWKLMWLYGSSKCPLRICRSQYCLEFSNVTPLKW